MEPHNYRLTKVEVYSVLLISRVNHNTFFLLKDAHTTKSISTCYFAKTIINLHSIALKLGKFTCNFST